VNVLDRLVVPLALMLSPPEYLNSGIFESRGPMPGPVLSELSFLVSVEAVWVDTADSEIMIVTMSPTLQALLSA
jgi:hypothetical protein